ncbi:MAG: HD domain-containing protein [Chloroflexi bacterium]|nr:HD domain-containing protein [Chloroflexota bacterium]
MMQLKQHGRAYRAYATVIGFDADAALVGGAVRDLFLHRPLHDLDFVTPHSALHLARRAADALGAAYYPLDKARGVGRVVWRETNASTPLVIDISELSGKKLIHDLRSRDFTINAMALLSDGSLYDPLHGREDLLARRLRPCSSQSLRKDPVRVLRAARFLTAFDLQPEQGFAELAAAAAFLLPRVSVERQRDEFLRLLGLATPEKALSHLDNWSVIASLLPELEALKHIEQPPPHAHGAYEHSLHSLHWMARIDRLFRLDEKWRDEYERALKSGLHDYQGRLREYLTETLASQRERWLWLRFAALAHDWGKAKTQTTDERGRVHFYHHEKLSGKLAAAWLKRFHCASAEIIFVRETCRGHMRPIHLSRGPRPPTRRSLYRFYRDLGDAAVGVILMHLADHLATYGPDLSAETFAVQVDFARSLLAPAFDRVAPILPKPLLNGREIMAHFQLEQGPQLGRLLESLREAQAAGQVTDREEALAFIRNLLKETH